MVNGQEIMRETVRLGRKQVSSMTRTRNRFFYKSRQGVREAGVVIKKRSGVVKDKYPRAEVALKMRFGWSGC